jgi:hypothetical protein
MFGHLVGALCIVKRRDVEKLRLSYKILAMIFCYMIYIFSWFIYYQGHVEEVVILFLCLAPCLTFCLYALDRKNLIAVLPLAVFTICHVIYGIIELG